MSAARIVVIRPGALGDALLTLPVLQWLSAAGAHVTAVGHPVFRLAIECGYAAEQIDFGDARLLGLFEEGGSCRPFAGHDLAIAYTRRSDPLLAANLRRSGVGSVVCWPAHPEPGIHIVDHLLGALGAAGIAPVASRPVLSPCGGWLNVARAWLGERGLSSSFAAIHPGSGGHAKRWPVERFAELARRTGGPILWLLGPAEAHDAEARRIGEQVGTVADDLPLPTLAGLLALCRSYVGNDSGVTHLAAAVGAPTLALFGPTDPKVWAPRGQHVAVLGSPDAGGLENISVEQVLRVLNGFQQLAGAGDGARTA